MQHLDELIRRSLLTRLNPNKHILVLSCSTLALGVNQILIRIPFFNEPIHSYLQVTKSLHTLYIYIYSHYIKDM